MSDTLSAHLHAEASDTLFQIAPEVATNTSAK